MIQAPGHGIVILDAPDPTVTTARLLGVSRSTIYRQLPELAGLVLSAITAIRMHHRR